MIFTPLKNFGYNRKIILLTLALSLTFSAFAQITNPVQDTTFNLEEKIKELPSFQLNDSLRFIKLDGNTLLLESKDSVIVLEIIERLKTLVQQDTSLNGSITEEIKEASKEKIWTHKGSLGFNFSNVGFNKYWSTGGESAVSLSSIMHYILKRETEFSHFENVFHFGYGVTKQGEKGFRKSDDELYIISHFSRKIFGEKWNLSGKIHFKTQIDEGIKYSVDQLTNEEQAIRISNFMAPGRLEVSSGMLYKTKIEDRLEFTGMFSPITGKMTMVLDDSVKGTDYGLMEGKKVLSELGIQVNSTLSAQIMENITFKNHINLFSNYEKMENVDVNWETLLVLRINKFFNTNFSTNFIYDDDVNFQGIDDNGDPFESGAKPQFKHVLNVGMHFIF
ncbi:MAG: DUF3078 domain-containing protein [Flammeovirgaceae bacterium]|nr:DUF3078 domain-containing protein [Flammeovirgaceae bacterium]